MSESAKNQNAVFALFSGEGALTIDQLTEGSPISRHETIKTVGYLLNRGYVDRLETGVFALTEEGREAKANGVVIKSGPMGPDTGKSRKPQDGTIRQAAWQAMRIMTIFSINDLVAVVSDAPTPQQHKNLRRYCWGLVQARLLMEMPNREAGAAESSNGFKRYRLLEDTGSIAPTYRNVKAEVFDHNTQEVHPCLG